MNVTLHLGDCLEYMRGMEAASVDCAVTSPPYDNLREYGGHSWDFEGVARELFRVVKVGGVVVWVIDDAKENGSETGERFKQALFFMSLGFNLHDTMIYRKLNGAVGSLNEYLQEFELMFVFSRGTPKTVNLLRDRKNVVSGIMSTPKSKSNGDSIGGARHKITSPEYGRRKNIWEYPVGSEGDTGGHPAIFPQKLARDHILSWTNEGDTVLDPFMGSGTTGKMAVTLQRNFIGCEIHVPYFQIAERRIREAQLQIPLDMGQTV